MFFGRRYRTIVERVWVLLKEIVNAMERITWAFAENGKKKEMRVSWNGRKLDASWTQACKKLPRIIPLRLQTAPGGRDVSSENR